MQELLAKLIAFQTTEDNSEEIKKGLEYIASLFDSPSSAGTKKFEVQWFEKNGKYSLLVSFAGNDALKPMYLLNGHFDVVPAETNDQYQMRVENGKAYGRGTFDMKGMVTVLIEVMLELGKQEDPPDVALLLNGDEEIGGANGAGYMAQEVGIRPTFVMCGDGGHEGEFRITTKEKGIAWVELHAEGKTAHGAYPWLGENALEKLIQAVGKIKQWVGPIEPNAWKTTVNFSMLNVSNKTPNKVPGEASAILDIRFTEELAKTPEELAEKIQTLVPEVSISLAAQGSLLFVDDTNQFVQSFKGVAENVLGTSVNFAFEHGATDTRYFTEGGATAVLIGGSGGNMHAAGEWVDLQSLETNKHILLEFFVEERRRV